MCVFLEFVRHLADNISHEKVNLVFIDGSIADGKTTLISKLNVLLAAEYHVFNVCEIGKPLIGVARAMQSGEIPKFEQKFYEEVEVYYKSQFLLTLSACKYMPHTKPIIILIDRSVFSLMLQFEHDCSLDFWEELFKSPFHFLFYVIELTNPEHLTNLLDRKRSGLFTPSLKEVHSLFTNLTLPLFLFMEYFVINRTEDCFEVV